MPEAKQGEVPVYTYPENTVVGAIKGLSSGIQMFSSRAFVVEIRVSASTVVVTLVATTMILSGLVYVGDAINTLANAIER